MIMPEHNEWEIDGPDGEWMWDGTLPMVQMNTKVALPDAVALTAEALAQYYGELLTEAAGGDLDYDAAMAFELAVEGWRELLATLLADARSGAGVPSLTTILIRLDEVWTLLAQLVWEYMQREANPEERLMLDTLGSSHVSALTEALFEAATDA